jgi:hypothetical protein
MLEPLAEYERELIVEGVNAGISRMSGDNRPGAPERHANIR